MREGERERERECVCTGKRMKCINFIHQQWERKKAERGVKKRVTRRKGRKQTIKQKEGTMK